MSNGARRQKPSVNKCILKHLDPLRQACQTRDPRAKCCPPYEVLWPAIFLKKLNLSFAHNF